MRDIGLRDGRGDACSSNVWLVGEATRGIRWRNFEQEAPDLAENVRGLIETFRFALLGTIRRDGTPRISPVETHLVRDDLMLVMIPQTRKVADIRRDRRLVLQSPIANPGNPGTEFKLRGVGAPEDEEEQRRAAADAIESFSGWRPRPTWLFLRVMLEDVTCIEWKTDGTASLARWSIKEGLWRPVQLRLDMEMGSYRRE